MKLALLAVAILGVVVSNVGAQTPVWKPSGRSEPETHPYPLEAPPVAKDVAEQKLLTLLLEGIPGKQGRKSNVPPTDGRMLRLLAEAIDAKTIVEIGTSNGISGIWMGLALRKTGGKLITHELDPATAVLARENFAQAGMSDIVTVVVGDAHQTVAALKGPIDMVFFDADRPGNLDYFQKVAPLVRLGGLICVHNMTVQAANPEFVKAITTNGDFETLFYPVGSGLSITLKKR